MFLVILNLLMTELIKFLRDAYDSRYDFKINSQNLLDSNLAYVLLMLTFLVL